jgi:pre-mRNA-splicing factor ATP-dependent RNA helicase DHX15/PRP43
MESLQRNNTTASQAIAIEDGTVHALRGGNHTAKYFDILRQRRALPVATRRQDFLDLYHDKQVSKYYNFLSPSRHIDRE